MIPLANRIEQFDKIVKMIEGAQAALNKYFFDYRIFTTFEYWLMIFFLIAPLVLLYFKIDKSKLFEICFYGYNIHVLFGYIDLYGRNLGYWNYPFPVLPPITGLSLDASLVPVTFMLVYQWTIKRKKNYYIYSLLTAVIFSFLFKPVLVRMGLFKLYQEINYIHLLICYVIVVFVAKWMMDLFLWIRRKYA